MKVYIDNVIDAEFDFDYENIAEKVCKIALMQENCPYDCEINITITDNDEICMINNETRNINNPTDVLSFPNIDFDAPGIFDIPTGEMALYLDPETELVVLGEIILSYDKIIEQANNYGHSVLREYAFLIAHSMLHLCGYDHMIPEDANLMEERQKMIMDSVNIKRD